MLAKQNAHSGVPVFSPRERTKQCSKLRLLVQNSQNETFSRSFRSQQMRKPNISIGAVRPVGVVEVDIRGLEGSCEALYHTHATLQGSRRLQKVLGATHVSPEGNHGGSTFVYRLCATTAHSEILRPRVVQFGTILDSKTTDSQKCEPVPRMAGI